MDDIILNRLKELCDKALNEDEVPISALVVDNNQIIGEGYNKMEQTQNFLKHAEIIAIENAMRYKKNWRLNGCTLYTTLEPCDMCKEIIKKSRISKVIYFASQKVSNSNLNIKYLNKNDGYFSKILSDFFKNKR